MQNDWHDSCKKNWREWTEEHSNHTILIICRANVRHSDEENRFNGGSTMTEPTKEDLLARIAELEKQAGAKKSGRMDFKVSEKGGVSVYGLGRFPVTLYYEQWVRLLDAVDALRAFLEENKSRLKLKE
jgi:hypothetical protein